MCTKAQIDRKGLEQTNRGRLQKTWRQRMIALQYDRLLNLPGLQPEKCGLE